MQHQEDEEGERGPEPAYFDKKDIKEIALLGEVARGLVGRM